jgi:flagellin
MGMVINTNIASLNAQRNLGKTQSILDRCIQRLSTGLRINSAKDDAAGLAISDRMTSQIRGINQAVRNANDGISLAQTAEGALQETTNMLQRIREIAVQAANDTNSTSDRQSLQAEVIQLKAEINRIAEATQFNGKNVLDGSMSNATFHVGANAHQVISVSIGDARATSIGAYQTASTQAQAAVLAGIDYAAADLVVLGSKGSATATIAVDDSAKTAAEAVNSVTADTGVTASARTTVDVTFSIDDNYSFEINGETVTGSVAGGDLSIVAESINAQAATTGVTATLNAAKNQITLTDNDGDNIEVTNFASVGAGQMTFGAAPALVVDGATAYAKGSVTLESSLGFAITDTLAAFASDVATLSKISDIDVTTVTDANNALSVVDKAIEKVDSIRANIGAMQSRFEATIANLQNVSENLSAARSRIMDADFAAETAELTKAQIIQQAGVAMLAQANILPQTVLSLFQ